MLQVSELYFSYDSGGTALFDISFAIPPGQVVGLLGVNGAGKTTLLRCLAGLYAPYKGSISLQDIAGEALRRDISFVSGEGAAFGRLTPTQLGDFMQSLYPGFRAGRYQKLLEFFALPDVPVPQLSKGQRSRAELALGFCRGASCLLLDEPFSGKDVFSRQDFLKIMAGGLQAHECILMSSHEIEEMEQIVDRALILHEGRLVRDVEMDALHESGRTLLEVFSDATGYDPGRAARIFEEYGQ